MLMEEAQTKVLISLKLQMVCMPVSNEGENSYMELINVEHQPHFVL